MGLRLNDQAALGGWCHVAASIIGSAHVKNALPCQDAHACTVLQPNRGESVLIGVVADGAGSASRSDEGARLTCNTVIETMKNLLDRGHVAELGRAEAEEIVASIRRRLEDRAKEYGEDVRQFACTLLVAAIGIDGAFYIQIGDGGIVASRRDDPEGFGWVFWPESGEYINQTCFVTAGDALERMQTECATGAVDEIALFSDGLQSLVLNYAARTVHEPFFSRMFSPLRAATERGTDLQLQAALEQFLARRTIAARTDDDLTLLLASRKRPPP